MSSSPQLNFARLIAPCTSSDTPESTTLLLVNTHTAHLLVDLFSEGNEYLLASSHASVSRFLKLAATVMIRCQFKASPHGPGRGYQATERRKADLTDEGKALSTRVMQLVLFFGTHQRPVYWGTLLAELKHWVKGGKRATSSAVLADLLKRYLILDDTP